MTVPGAAASTCTACKGKSDSLALISRLPHCERFGECASFHWSIGRLPRLNGAGPERSYDVRDCRETATAIQSADASGGARHPRTRCVSWRAAAAQPGAEG